MPALGKPASPRRITRAAGHAGLAASGLLLSFALAGQALGHGDEPHEAAIVWTFDPWIVLPLAATALLFARGAIRLYGRAGRARPRLGLRIALFSLGLLALAGALMSPLHALGEALFTAHMIEHEIVMAVAAPLMVMARPLALLLLGLPHGLRRFAGRALRSPSARGLWSVLASGLVATLLHGAVIWIWHVPALFDMTVDHILYHRLQHVSFLATALLFWWAVLWRPGRGLAAWHLFATMMHTSLLGALMALSPVVLYGAQTRLAPAFGLSPLEDQQLAGMLMWVPAGTVYAGAALYMLAEWIRKSGREATHAPSPL